MALPKYIDSSTLQDAIDKGSAQGISPIDVVKVLQTNGHTVGGEGLTPEQIIGSMASPVKQQHTSPVIQQEQQDVQNAQDNPTLYPAPQSKMTYADQVGQTASINANNFGNNVNAYQQNVSNTFNQAVEAQQHAHDLTPNLASPNDPNALENYAERAVEGTGTLLTGAAKTVGAIMSPPIDLLADTIAYGFNNVVDNYMPGVSDFLVNTGKAINAVKQSTSNAVNQYMTSNGVDQQEAERRLKIMGVGAEGIVSGLSFLGGKKAAEKKSSLANIDISGDSFYQTIKDNVLTPIAKNASDFGLNKEQVQNIVYGTVDAVKSAPSVLETLAKESDAIHQENVYKRALQQINNTENYTDKQFVSAGTSGKLSVTQGLFKSIDEFDKEGSNLLNNYGTDWVSKDITQSARNVESFLHANDSTISTLLEDPKVEALHNQSKSTLNGTIWNYLSTKTEGDAFSTSSEYKDVINTFDKAIGKNPTLADIWKAKSETQKSYQKYLNDSSLQNSPAYQSALKTVASVTHDYINNVIKSDSYSQIMKASQSSREILQRIYQNINTQRNSGIASAFKYVMNSAMHNPAHALAATGILGAAVSGKIPLIGAGAIAGTYFASKGVRALLHDTAAQRYIVAAARIIDRTASQSGTGFSKAYNATKKVLPWSDEFIMRAKTDPKFAEQIKQLSSLKNADEINKYFGNHPKLEDLQPASNPMQGSINPELPAQGAGNKFQQRIVPVSSESPLAEKMKSKTSP